MAASSLFYVLAAGALLTALAMVTARNVVHAVLFMVVNFALTAGLYLLLHAPFLAMVQVAVYAGAIMVLFLFAVMLLGRQEAGLDEPLVGHRPLGIGLTALLGCVLVYVVREGVPAAGSGGAQDAVPARLPPEFGSAQAIGEALFRWHVLSFEVISVLLLVAVLGAVVIARSLSPRAGDRSDEGDA